MRKDLEALHKKQKRGEIGVAASNTEPTHSIADLLGDFLSTGSDEARRGVLTHPYRGAVVLLGKRLGPDEDWSIAHDRLVKLLEFVGAEEVQNPMKSGAFPGSPVAGFFVTWSRWARGEATAMMLESALESVNAFGEVKFDLSFLLTTQLSEDWDKFSFEFQSKVMSSIAVRLDTKMTKIRALLGDTRLADWLAIDIERQLESKWEPGREPNAKWISALVDLEGCSERAITMLARGCAKGLWGGLACSPSFVPHFCKLLHNDQYQDVALKVLLARELTEAILEHGTDAQRQRVREIEAESARGTAAEFVPDRFPETREEVRAILLSQRAARSWPANRYDSRAIAWLLDHDPDVSAWVQPHLTSLARHALVAFAERFPQQALNWIESLVEEEQVDTATWVWVGAASSERRENIRGQLMSYFPLLDCRNTRQRLVSAAGDWLKADQLRLWDVEHSAFLALSRSPEGIELLEALYQKASQLAREYAVKELSKHPTLGQLRLIQRLQAIEPQPGFEKCLQAQGWNLPDIPALRDFIERSALPSLGLGLAKFSGPGRSYFGGQPELPDELEWPELDGQPLQFLLQIDLKDIADWKHSHLLPSEGLLSFFFSDYITARKAVVFHLTKHGRARVGPVPAFPKCGLEFYPQFRLPLDYGLEFSKDSEEDCELFDWYKEELSATDGHALLGWSYPVQGAASTDELLLEFDTDDRVGVEWVDCGKAHFMKPKVLVPNAPNVVDFEMTFL